MKLTKEIWKDVKGYEGVYKVSNIGTVKSLKRRGRTSDRILKNHNVKGYYMVKLTLENKGKMKSVHQLVAMAFLGHSPDGTNKLVVDHINNIKTDNRVENLQIISNRENTSKDRQGGSSKYVGVTFCKRDSKWIAQITLNGKLKRIGSYKNEHDAHLAYQNKLTDLGLTLTKAGESLINN